MLRFFACCSDTESSVAHASRAQSNQVVTVSIPLTESRSVLPTRQSESSGSSRAKMAAKYDVSHPHPLAPEEKLETEVPIMVPELPRPKNFSFSLPQIALSESPVDFRTEAEKAKIISRVGAEANARRLSALSKVEKKRAEARRNCQQAKFNFDQMAKKERIFREEFYMKRNKMNDAYEMLMLETQYSKPLEAMERKTQIAKGNWQAQQKMLARINKEWEALSLAPVTQAIQARQAPQRAGIRAEIAANRSARQHRLLNPPPKEDPIVEPDVPERKRPELHVDVSLCRQGP